LRHSRKRDVMSDDIKLNRRNVLLGSTTPAAASVLGSGAPMQAAQAQQQRPHLFCPHQTGAGLPKSGSAIEGQPPGGKGGMKGQPKKRQSDQRAEAPPVSPVSAVQRRDEGRRMRERCPRSSQAQLGLRGAKHDPVALIKESSEGRVENLIPLRYTRMLESPF